MFDNLIGKVMLSNISYQQCDYSQFYKVLLNLLKNNLIRK